MLTASVLGPELGIARGLGTVVFSIVIGISLPFYYLSAITLWLRLSSVTPKLIFARSGSADVGEFSDQATRRMMADGAGTPLG